MDNEKSTPSFTNFILILCYLFGGGIVAFLYLNSIPPNSTPPLPVVTNLPPSSQPQFCTSFDYSRWSHCAEDGTQSRVITEAYPKGCLFVETAPITQEQLCKYIPENISPTNIINAMVGQIYDAPNQTITTQYFAGQSDDLYIATNKWRLATDGGTTLFLESTSTKRSTGVVTDHIILADTNSDFRPDMYRSDNSDNWYDLGSQGADLIKNYTLVWAVANAYFASYLLN